jgi:beta-lactamase class A
VVRLAVIALLVAAATVAASTPATASFWEAEQFAGAAAKRSAPLTTTAGIRRARRFAHMRQGTVAFAVLDGRTRPRGLRRTLQFQSASVSKAMLLVAVLRRAGRRKLSATERGLVKPMITVSDNDAASALYARVGGDGLRRVARAAGMNRFMDAGHWAAARITAADQARLFLHIDELVPAAHRRYARKLLSSIVGPQRWGIARIARGERVKAFFKGGWRNDVTHQVALLERSGRRIALAVLTKGSPSMAYAVETIERIAARVLE